MCCACCRNQSVWHSKAFLLANSSQSLIELANQAEEFSHAGVDIQSQQHTNEGGSEDEQSENQFPLDFPDYEADENFKGFIEPGKLAGLELATVTKQDGFQKKLGSTMQQKPMNYAESKSTEDLAERKECPQNVKVLLDTDQSNMGILTNQKEQNQLKMVSPRVLNKNSFYAINDEFFDQLTQKYADKQLFDLSENGEAVQTHLVEQSEEDASMNCDTSVEFNLNNMEQA